MAEASLVPWSRVASWTCDGCGECCGWFTAPVAMYEYARISHSYGFDVVTLGLGRAYLRRRGDGRCIFQYCEDSRWLCGLQADKPYVCKMWPFTVCKEPLHGRQQAASWDGPYGRVYVYVDLRCPRLTLGEPTQYLIDKVLPESVDIAMGKRTAQLYTTRIPPQAVAAQPGTGYHSFL